MGPCLLWVTRDPVLTPAGRKQTLPASFPSSNVTPEAKLTGLSRKGGPASRPAPTVSVLAWLSFRTPGQLACSRPRPVLGETALGAAIGVGVAVVVCRHDQAVIRARSATSWRR